MIEKQITAKIKDYLKSKNIYHWKQWQGTMSTHGVSDIIGILPGGRFLAIEVKQPGKKTSILQQQFLDTIADNGGLAFIATSVDDVILKLNEVIYE